MKKAYVDPQKCDRSPFCPAKRVCPVGAITQERSGFFGGGVSKVDEEKCIGCGKCVNFCPAGAIRMK
ncbi:4Fe-4S binding protein [Thermobrachium celere]|uniref:4Fe-4S ferredoxin, iron-sulfur binding domain protein n=1 Tax=Thermobrachium celere DSM 8682 TaxID=941824 RepID=R7RPY2_9CLOT|nr:4Fe-4S binding protein [Thermobrachium celere]GFR35762.1 hypothetical protein TCEA9_15740 [Thermobrachium celere]CDF58267.1 4Fe-4S ferredoxin, iron-sulfur binding domain protein [Thermobrachium celere DSM 8682]